MSEFEPIRIVIPPCTGVDAAARRLVAMSRFTGKEVVADFNGVEIFAVPRVTPEMIVEHYYRVYYARNPSFRA